jgi:hypothetical protein
MEMSLHLFQNEMLLHVVLGSLKAHKPVEAIDMLKQMGFQPDLKYYKWQKEGEEKTEVCALLHRGIATDPESDFSDLEVQWRKLADVFGSEAVHLVWGAD